MPTNEKQIGEKSCNDCRKHILKEKCDPIQCLNYNRDKFVPIPPPQPEKSCENCVDTYNKTTHYPPCYSDKGCPKSKYNPPPQPDEVVEVFVSHRAFTRAKNVYAVTKNVKVKINPNSSPELIAWADKRTRKLIEIDERVLEDMKYSHGQASIDNIYNTIKTMILNRLKN